MAWPITAVTVNWMHTHLMWWHFICHCSRNRRRLRDFHPSPGLAVNAPHPLTLVKIRRLTTEQAGQVWGPKTPHLYSTWQDAPRPTVVSRLWQDCLNTDTVESSLTKMKEGAHTWLSSKSHLQEKEKPTVYTDNQEFHTVSGFNIKIFFKRC